MIPDKSTNITIGDLRKLTKDLDVVLVRRRKHWTGKLIAWAQRKMLKEFGHSDEEIEKARVFIHCFLVYMSDIGQCVETNPPKARKFDISDYFGNELLVLRHKVPLDHVDKAKGRVECDDMKNTSYDLGEYMIYPFYMIKGKAPMFWEKLWDNTDKPVCSGFVTRAYNAMGRMLSYRKDIKKVIPAKLALIDEFEIVGRYELIDDGSRRGVESTKPIWLR